MISRRGSITPISLRFVLSIVRGVEGGNPNFYVIAMQPMRNEYSSCRAESKYEVTCLLD